MNLACVSVGVSVHLCVWKWLFFFLPRPSVQPTESLFSASKDWIENRCGLLNATEAKRQMLPLYSHRECGSSSSSSSAGDWEHLRPLSGWIIVSLIFWYFFVLVYCLNKQNISLLSKIISRYYFTRYPQNSRINVFRIRVWVYAS